MGVSGLKGTELAELFLGVGGRLSTVNGPSAASRS